MTIINKLFQIEGNKVRKIFRALGLQLAQKHGVHTDKQIQLKRITNEIGELVALGFVKIYTPLKSCWNQGAITLNYIGFTNKGWMAWLKDNGKHNYYECPIELASRIYDKIEIEPNHSIIDAFMAMFSSNEDEVNDDADEFEQLAREEAQTDNVSRDVDYNDNAYTEPCALTGKCEHCGICAEEMGE